MLSRLKRHLFHVAVVAVCAGLFVTIALADDGEPRADVAIRWGELLVTHADMIVYVIMSGLLWASRGLPAEWQARLRTARAEQLLTHAVRYGVNAVAGASADKVLSVHVANPVLASALTYALDKGAPALVSWMGGPTSIAEMIWARLDVSPEAGRPDLEAITGRTLAAH